ncbi:MAG TPA: hypothetical protein VL793_02415, partial [Patescibacteria group bacterium]|nr:hypothetical protein [Patescibacteria group bacterium]
TPFNNSDFDYASNCSGGYLAKRTLPAFDLAQMGDLQAFQKYKQSLLTSGPLPWLLYPFRLLIRPYLAPDSRTFLGVLGPALALLLLHYWWVARSDIAFEEASVEASKRLAEKVAALRSGNWQSARRGVRRRAPFVLGGVGSPVIALLWKNLISAGQAFTARLWIIVAATALMICGFLVRTAEDSNLVAALGMAAGMLVAWSLFIGPQILRQDLRQDLPLTDMLKMYPIRGWEVALGELLAPATILTGVQWLLLLIATILLWHGPSSFFTRPITLGIGAGAALMVPLLNLIILQIPNAAVVLFPAWFQTGKDRAAGIEVTGQRIIAIFAQLLVFVIAMIPTTIAFAVLFVISQPLLGRPIAILFASSGSAIVLGAEAAVGILLLGRLFERFDISAELPPG